MFNQPQSDQGLAILRAAFESQTTGGASDQALIDVIAYMRRHGFAISPFRVPGPPDPPPARPPDPPPARQKGWA